MIFSYFFLKKINLLPDKFSQGLTTVTSTLNVLMLFYCLLLGANTAISYLYWRNTGQSLFKTSFALWGFCLINFVLQGIFRTPDIWLLLAFGSYIFVSMSFLRFCEQIFKKENEFTKMPFISMAFVIASFITWISSNSMLFSSTLMSLAISIPLFRAAHFLIINNWNKRLEINVFASLLIINGLHFLDYPILRFTENGPIWGYSTALFILVLFSIFLPLFIVTEISSEYSSKLETEVSRKTKELKYLWELNRSLLCIVIHDLATPLTVLQLSSNQLLNSETRNSDEVEKHHEKIKNAIKVMSDIISKIREFQALNNGKKVVHLDPIDPYLALKETLFLFEDHLSKKNINTEIINNLPAGTYLLADEKLLKIQILGNIISNAIKFSPPSTTIKITLHEDGQKGYIEIRDHGIGIPKDILSKVFDFSSKTSRPGTLAEKGTGFGLPLAKTCAEIMNAKINVSSIEQTELASENGTTFTVQLEKAS